MRSVAAVVAFVAFVHAGLWILIRSEPRAPDFSGQLASVSYAPFAGSTHPDKGNRPSIAQIRSDLKMLAPYTRAIRTYSSTGGVDLVPGIAKDFGLKVTVGAWIDKNEARNEREIRAALDLAQRHSNVNGIVVGNETIFRGEQKIEDLIKIINRVKRTSPVPVTTGEIWHVWMEHRELAAAVDFIAAHVLPYWEGFSEKVAVEQAILIYDKLREAFPGKRIVIAEFGWPIADSDHFRLAGLALLLGFLLSLPILRLHGATVGQAALLSVSANVVGAWFAAVFGYWNGHYFVPGAAFALALGILLLIPLAVIALSRMEEIASVVFGRGPRRLVAPSLAPALPAEPFVPKISIH